MIRIANFEIPWPIGLALALGVVVLAVWLVRRVSRATVATDPVTMPIHITGTTDPSQAQHAYAAVQHEVDIAPTAEVRSIEARKNAGQVVEWTVRVSYFGGTRLHAYSVGWDHNLTNPQLTVQRLHYNKYIRDSDYAIGEQAVRAAVISWIAQNQPS